MKKQRDVPGEVFTLINETERLIREVIPSAGEGDLGTAFLRLNSAVDLLARVGRVLHEDDATFEAVHVATERILRLTDGDQEEGELHVSLT